MRNPGPRLTLSAGMGSIALLALLVAVGASGTASSANRTHAPTAIPTFDHAAPGTTAAPVPASAPDTLAVPMDTPEPSVKESLAVPAMASFEDTSAFRWEIGSRADVTNEQYYEYEDAFRDTTFLVRKRVDTPEQRYAGIVFTTLQGTRGARSTRYELQNELSLGDLIRRDALNLRWQTELTPDLRLTLAPRGEYRHDRTFDRDRDEARAAVSGTLRRALGDGFRAAELALRGDIVRSQGEGTEFLLDRNTAGAWVALDQFGVLGDDWRVGLGTTARAFPDSAERDHLEHGWEAQWRRTTDRGHAIGFETRGFRRNAVHQVTTSRDDYWDEEGAVDGELRAADGLQLKLRLEAEAIQYDREDSTLFFDYSVTRATAGVRFDRDPRWSATVGPRIELLGSRLNPSESYWEAAGVVDFERLGHRAWWTISPAVGWREYDETDGALPGSTAALHSSYAFYEVSAFGDQPVIADLHLRGYMTLRAERHTDEGQDASSLYCSIELRWVPR